MGRIKQVAAVVAAATLGGLVVVGTPQAASAAEDQYCRTTEGSNDFYPGPSASATYDAVFHESVPVPAGLLDGGYVPQGLAYWDDWNGTSEDILLISAYRDGGGPSGIWGVVLSGTNRGDSLGRMLVPEGHVGGLAMAGGYVYVSSGGDVRFFPQSEVRSTLAAANTNTTHYGRTDPVAGKASFLGRQGNTVWAGNFDGENDGYVERSMWQYSVGSGGYLSPTGAKRSIPGKAQGMATVGDFYVFGTSEFRTDRGNVWLRRASNTDPVTDANSFCMRAPSMIEGMARGVSNGNDHVWALFESGAQKYSGARNPIRHIHWADSAELTALYGRSD